MRGYFHTDSDLDKSVLLEALSRAVANGQSFRVNVENGVLIYKVGAGSWSPPVRSTPDAYRDAPLDWEDDLDTGYVAPVRLSVGPDGQPMVNL